MPIRLALLLLLTATLVPPAHAAGDPAAGRAQAAMRCQACHGVNGLSQQPNAPNIAGDPEIYLVKQLEAFKSGQRQDEQMSVVVQDLTPKDIADLAAWYAAIQVEAILP